MENILIAKLRELNLLVYPFTPIQYTALEYKKYYPSFACSFEPQIQKLNTIWMRQNNAISITFTADFDGDCINHVEVQDINAYNELAAINKSTRLLLAERLLTRIDNKLTKRDVWIENNLNYKKINKLILNRPQNKHQMQKHQMQKHQMQKHQMQKHQPQKHQPQKHQPQKHQIRNMR